MFLRIFSVMISTFNYRWVSSSCVFLWLIALHYGFEAVFFCLHFCELSACNTQKIISREVRFNPSEVRLNIEKLRKLTFWNLMSFWSFLMFSSIWLFTVIIHSLIFGLFGTKIYTVERRMWNRNFCLWTLPLLNLNSKLSCSNNQSESIVVFAFAFV